jgi:hypothetical protein
MESQKDMGTCLNERAKKKFEDHKPPPLNQSIRDLISRMIQEYESKVAV